jgi:hypothetical protein
MSFNARIRETKRIGYSSYTFSITENWRDDKKGGKPNHRDVVYLGTVKEHFLYSPIVQNNLYLKINIAINKLLKSGEIDTADAKKIKNRFSEFLSSVKVGAIPAIPAFSSKMPLRKKPIV